MPSQPSPLGDYRLAPCWTNSFVNSGGSCHSPATEPRWPPGARQARVRSQEGLTQPPCPAHPGGPVLMGERSGEPVPVLPYLSQPQPCPTLQETLMLSGPGPRAPHGDSSPAAVESQGRVGILRPQGKLSALPTLPECLLSPHSSRLGVKRPEFWACLYQ